MSIPQQLDVQLLPTLVEPAELAGKAVVVIDVLRATTTIIHALAAGAKQVLPCLEVEEALHKAARIGSDVLLGGERGGQRIPGFDLGNSPRDYRREAAWAAKQSSSRRPTGRGPCCGASWQHGC